MSEPEFAKLFQVIYKWPDEIQWKLGLIIYTNLSRNAESIEDYEEIANMCNVTDNDVLIYTNTLNPEEISETFDGLEVSGLCEI